MLSAREAHVCSPVASQQTSNLFAAVVLYSPLMLTFFSAYAYSSHDREEWGVVTVLE